MTSAAGKAMVRMRIVISEPVPGVLHSLQEDDAPLDAKRSVSGEPLAFDLGMTIAPGPKFSGKQVRREGPLRRFVYVRVGVSAGDCLSPWNRRMKIDIHDIPPDLIAQAIAGGRLIATVSGTGKDGSPACATIRPVDWRIELAD